MLYDLVHSWYDIAIFMAPPVYDIIHMISSQLRYHTPQDKHDIICKVRYHADFYDIIHTPDLRCEGGSTNETVFRKETRRYYQHCCAKSTCNVLLDVNAIVAGAASARVAGCTLMGNRHGMRRGAAPAFMPPPPTSKWKSSAQRNCGS